MKISITGTLCLEQPGVKSFARGQDEDAPSLTSCWDQNCDFEVSSPKPNLYSHSLKRLSPSFVYAIVFILGIAIVLLWEAEER